MTDDDPAEDGITFTAEEFAVSADETVSTGDYENYDAYASLSGAIDGVGEMDAETRRVIRSHLLALHHDLQDVVERAAANRVKLSDQENWEDPQ